MPKPPLPLDTLQECIKATFSPCTLTVLVEDSADSPIPILPGTSVRDGDRAARTRAVYFPRRPLFHQTRWDARGDTADDGAHAAKRRVPAPRAALDYLLASSFKADLEHVIRHHVVIGVEYADTLIEDSQRTFATLEGSNLQIEQRGVSDILIPRSVHLVVGKLVKAGKATTMTTLLVKAGLGWVLNGTAPPEGSRWVDMSLSGTGWTLLCPP
ncbi:uncharacterized protein TRAVEDRAFT_20814 [Trametes versicolor FP-101664 SS1]|uniref:uncharacterized protein n=1 Tax=Trametes versicolor (strain FP-101664) TaxID=717944 RepID=UPI00046242CB|nr:uncharacterized protein TRAVEDRAFT_20814 [Trametes versicolor FP-101664 SS1]EIW59013.1 hypothetical protein TRAVEDRAFT_20814 [Trametes versicolor FP-101664 SS1]